MGFMEYKQEKSLGELLLQNGKLRPEQLQLALSEQQRTAEPLGKTLIRLGYVHEEEVLQALKGLLVVVFKLEQEDFAFEALYVQHIITWQAVNKLPKMPEYIEGLLNHRGKIIPVINLAIRLGRTPGPIGEDARIIVVEKTSQFYGLLVDGVEAVMQLPLEKIESSPTLLHRIDPRFLYGVGKYEKRIITLLHLDPILSEVMTPESSLDGGETV